MTIFAARVDLNATNRHSYGERRVADLIGDDVGHLVGAIAPPAVRGFSEVAMTAASARIHDTAAVANPGEAADIDLSIFVSCYNEEAFIIGTIETIRSALEKVGGLTHEIIVIDDASHDRSADLVQEYMASHSEERILLRRNQTNRGLAQNYLDAAFIGKGKYYRLICGDNSEPVDTMIAVFREIGAADMLIPHYVTAEGKSLFRRTVSNAYTLLVNAITGYRLPYYNGLAVHLRYNVMRWHPNTRGFGFQADIICMLLDQGFTYKEVPVRTIERKKGDSKALTFKNMLSIAHTLVDLVIRSISNRVYTTPRTAAGSATYQAITRQHRLPVGIEPLDAAFAKLDWRHAGDGGRRF